MLYAGWSDIVEILVLSVAVDHITANTSLTLLFYNTTTFLVPDQNLVSLNGRSGHTGAVLPVDVNGMWDIKWYVV